LAVSFSSTDYIGHSFGPNSVENEDTYLRLDNDLASFLSYLDNKIWQGTIYYFSDGRSWGSKHAGSIERKQDPCGALSVILPF
jgi:hypothetical protein